MANFSKPSVFGSDSDSDDDKRPGKTGLLGPGDSQKRQARLMQEKALQEDPTVFQYDELYDEIESKRQEAKKSKSTEEKKPKYIKKLLETAEKRKKEYERRIERQVQKEREEEGEKYKDKESFVTSAYKKKLEEMQKAEEEEKREAYLESIGDVTKQKDLDGFYRHIYEQKMGKESPKNYRDDEEVEKESGIKTPEKGSKKERSYRKRKASAEEADAEPEEPAVVKKSHLQSNIDADSDFSIDSSSESDDEDDKEEKPAEGGSKAELPQPPNKDTHQTARVEEKPQSGQKDDMKVPEQKGEEAKDDAKEPKKPIPPKEKKPKVNIWAKRTVGEIFEAAVQRYYERKAARSGG